MPILVDCASKTSLENHANFALNFFFKKTRVVYCLNALFFDYLKFAAITVQQKDREKEKKSRLITFSEYCVQCSLLLFARNNLDVIIYYLASAFQYNWTSCETVSENRFFFDVNIFVGRWPMVISSSILFNF